MAYTREKPATARSSDELRRTIPGWGADLNPADRPSYPKEAPQNTGAHWDFPERQRPRGPREKSTAPRIARDSASIALTSNICRWTPFSGRRHMRSSATPCIWLRGSSRGGRRE